MATRPKERSSRLQGSNVGLIGSWRRALWPIIRKSRVAALFPKWWAPTVHVALMLAAGAMRLWDLGSRAMHHDESLHALYSWYLYTGSGYRHDPMMHGPLQMEATAAAFFISGDSEFTARLVYALAGTALVGLPFLFRARLGNLGAVLTSAMLAFSPAMLYFSRFARNDILVAVWTLGLVICMWRYIDERRNRYLYIGAALLAFAFATKETAYIVTTTLGLYLFLVVMSQHWPAIKAEVTIGRVSPPVALMRIVKGAWTQARGLRLSEVSRQGGFLVLLFTLSLPLGAALVSVFQNTPLLSWSNLVLAHPVGGSGPIGAPSGGGLVIAGLVVLGALWISASVGFHWGKWVWVRCAGIFGAVWVTLYTTFFTNIAGLGSGVWQSLGYWLVQQGEARGSQPLYYYLVITPLYEFLPLLFAIIGGVYYMRRKDPFGHFMVFWAVVTFFLYTLASEKMPWLLVNVTLPLIVLSGKFLADIITTIQWRRLASGGGLLLLPGVPLVLVLMWRLAFFDPGQWGLFDVLVILASVFVLVAIVISGIVLARRVGYQNFAGFALIPVAVILLVLSARAAWYASYRNGDTPVEMLVYTQTSPHIVELLRFVEQAGDGSGNPTEIPITIDQTGGFTWPWAWYLRDYNRIGYRSYESAPLQDVPDSSVLLVHSRNEAEVDPLLTDRYSEGTRIKHRWWFPEVYRDLTVRKLLGSVVDRGAWRRTMDYFLYRELGTPLGSEDAYVYFSQDVPPGFTPTK